MDKYVSLIKCRTIRKHKQNMQTKQEVSFVQTCEIAKKTKVTTKSEIKQL